MINRRVDGLLAHGDVAQIKIGLCDLRLIVEFLRNGQGDGVMATRRRKIPRLFMHRAGNAFRQIARPLCFLPCLLQIPFMNVEHTTLEMQLDTFGEDFGCGLECRAIGGERRIAPSIPFQRLAQEQRRVKLFLILRRPRHRLQGHDHLVRLPHQLIERPPDQQQGFLGFGIQAPQRDRFKESQGAPGLPPVDLLIAVGIPEHHRSGGLIGQMQVMGGGGVFAALGANGRRLGMIVLAQLNRQVVIDDLTQGGQQRHAPLLIGNEQAPGQQLGQRACFRCRAGLPNIDRRRGAKDSQPL